MRKPGRYTVYDTHNDRVLINDGTIEECSAVLGIKPSSFYVYIQTPRKGISVERCGSVSKKIKREEWQKGWKKPEDGLPEDSDVVLVAVSGKYRNVEFIGAVMLATFDTEEDGGWILEEYPEWLNPHIECWTYIPPLPLSVRKYIDERMGE